MQRCRMRTPRGRRGFTRHGGGAGPQGCGGMHCTAAPWRSLVNTGASASMPAQACSNLKSQVAAAVQGVPIASQADTCKQPCPPRPPLPLPPPQIPVSENYAVVVQNPLLYNVRALLLGQVSSPRAAAWAGASRMPAPTAACLGRAAAPLGPVCGPPGRALGVCTPTRWLFRPVAAHGPSCPPHPPDCRLHGL